MLENGFALCKGDLSTGRLGQVCLGKKRCTLTLSVACLKIIFQQLAGRGGSGDFLVKIDTLK